jgi:hypothetical protein
MTVAYLFATNMASTTKLATMILPQLERGTHGVKVAGMMFFDDNVYCLRAGDPVGERWRRWPPSTASSSWCAIVRRAPWPRGRHVRRMRHGQCDGQGLVNGVVAGCFRSSTPP